MNSYNKKYQLIETYAVLLIDLICVSLSYFVAYLMRFGVFDGIRSRDRWLQVYLFCLFFCLLYNFTTDGYRHFFKRGYFEEFLFVFKYNIVMFLVVSAGVYALRMELDFSRLVLGYFVVINLFLSYGVRLLFKRLMRSYYRKSYSSDKILVVTTSDELEKVMDHIKKDHAWSYEIIGIALMDRSAVGEMVENIPIVADKDGLIDVAMQRAIDVVFIHYPEAKNGELENMIQSFLAMGVICHNCVERFGLENQLSRVGQFASFPVLTYSLSDIDYRRRIIKRLMDIAGGLVGLVFTGIITPFVALAIKLDSRGPVLFSQIRIGRNGRRFRIYKFRSMYIDAEGRKAELMKQNEMNGLMFKMDKDPRITRVGAFLRKTSIDELPQFWNVLKGDMSLVGTRPPTVDEFENYNIYYRRRLSITPGLTGMWQVSGRSDIKDFDEVVKLDLQYIDEWSLRKDVKILLMTVWVVLFRRGSK